MSWVKLVLHDLRCGLLRWRYLLAVLLFLLPCAVCRAGQGPGGTWGDYMMYCFMGSTPLDFSSELELSLPIFWLLEMSGCLLLNLDYLLNDLTNAGQQVILRSQTRGGWYASKCLWNLLATVLYFLAGCLTVWFFALVAGARGTLANDPVVTLNLFCRVLEDVVSLSSGQVLVCAILLPLLTGMAYSILEMTLCLFIKPVVSFLTCMALLVTACYWNSPFILGCGAMVTRSSFLLEDGITPDQTAGLSLGIIALCCVIGMLCFRRTDILGLEE